VAGKITIASPDKDLLRRRYLSHDYSKELLYFVTRSVSFHKLISINHEILHTISQDVSGAGELRQLPEVNIIAKEGLESLQILRIKDST
jgi:hypothetical protein